MTNPTTGLRFAPLIRVSTEKQEDQKQSLLDQTEYIKQCVKSLHGTIPNRCWQYCGQEHATPEYERTKLDRLLEDCAKNKFDAVMVYDASRWSRDNLKHEQGIRIFREKNIRFFIGTIEMNLFDPNAETMLSMQVLFAQHQAKIQKLKSITSRISRAKRNIPSIPKPYGRTFNKETEKWGVDEEKKEKITLAAQRYLAGESMIAIAEMLGMNHSNLWKILNRRSGDEWIVRFEAKDLGIDEVVPIKIPPLLDDDTIKAIHERARANKTYRHGERKNRYLLGHMIFCAACGSTFTGEKPHIRYYRHPRPKTANCHSTKNIPADLIESAVLIKLIRAFGDPKLLEEAVARATPDMEKIKKLQKEHDYLQRELKAITAEKDNVVIKMAKDRLTDEEADNYMKKYRERKASIEGRLDEIKTELDNLPDPDKVKQLLNKVSKKILEYEEIDGEQIYLNAMENIAHRAEHVFEMSYEDRRYLIEHAFAGCDRKGRHLGVYIQETGDPKQPWKFQVRGILESTMGVVFYKGLKDWPRGTIEGLPLDDLFLYDAFELDNEYQDVDAELKKIRDSITRFSQQMMQK